VGRTVQLPSTGELTSGWQYAPGLQSLVVDSLEYDDQQRVSKFRLYSFEGVTSVTVPQTFTAARDSALISFVYPEKDSLPASYLVTARYNGDNYKDEKHILTYDNQRRITGDSTVGITGNDNDGYSAAFGDTRKSHYSYDGSNIISTSYDIYGMRLVDTMLVTNGNITEQRDWSYYSLQSEGSLDVRVWNISYTDMENPYFKYKVFRNYFLGANIFGTVSMMPMSRDLVKGNTTTLDPQTPDLHMTMQWTKDSKGRVVSGEYN
jgi:hypothetical protein